MGRENFGRSRGNDPAPGAPDARKALDADGRLGYSARAVRRTGALGDGGACRHVRAHRSARRRFRLYVPLFERRRRHFGSTGSARHFRQPQGQKYRNGLGRSFGGNHSARALYGLLLKSRQDDRLQRQENHLSGHSFGLLVGRQPLCPAGRHKPHREGLEKARNDDRVRHGVDGFGADGRYCSSGLHVAGAQRHHFDRLLLQPRVRCHAAGN